MNDNQTELPSLSWYQRQKLLWPIAFPRRVREEQKERYRENHEHRKQYVCEQQRRYREANREKLREYGQRYRLKHTPATELVNP
jgi:hypothetical protein